jgi:hypothetical protein
MGHDVMCHVEYALWLVPSGPEATALRYLMEFRPRPDKPKSEKPKNDKPKDTKPKDVKPKDDKSKGNKSEGGKSRGGKSDDGKSKDGKSKDGKSTDGKSKDGKSKDDKSKSNKSSTHSVSSHSTSAHTTSSYSRPAYPRSPYPRTYDPRPPYPTSFDFRPPYPTPYDPISPYPTPYGPRSPYLTPYGPRSPYPTPYDPYPISFDHRLSYPRLYDRRPSHFRSRHSRSYPLFEPHITLATFWCPHRPSIFQFLPTATKTIPVKFESMKVGDDFLNSLFIVATKSPELMQLRDSVMDHMKENFMRASSPPSFPHLSLFYLDESFKGERLLLSKQLRETGRVHEKTGGEANFSLNCAVDGAGPHFDAMKGFEGMQIWLVDITEGVEDWVVLDRRDLKPRMPKAKVYVTRGEPYFDIFRDEAPEPYQVREMASYMPRWGEPSHFSGIYGPMAPHFPLDPR